jgi:hypothetical protein
MRPENIIAFALLLGATVAIIPVARDFFRLTFPKRNRKRRGYEERVRCLLAIRRIEASADARRKGWDTRRRNAEARRLIRVGRDIQTIRADVDALLRAEEAGI